MDPDPNIFGPLGSVIICMDPDPVSKSKKVRKNLDFYYFFTFFTFNYEKVST